MHTNGYPRKSTSVRLTHEVMSDLDTTQTAITGGKLMLVGMGTRSTTLPLSAAALREVDIQGSFRYANTYPEALELLGSGRLPNLDKLVTHRFTLADTAKAFDLLSKGADERGRMALKVVIGPSQ